LSGFVYIPNNNPAHSRPLPQ
jgi:hypothetical protein